MSAPLVSPWLKLALIGVDGSAPLPDHALLGALHAALAERSDDPAFAFSCALGAVGACRLAAVVFDAETSATPASAQDDPRMLATSHPWTGVLATSFADGPPRLQHEACLQLAAAHSTLPGQLLPLALEAGARSQALRIALLPVLGHRGRWLAQFNPDWRFALDGTDATQSSDDPRLWTEGNLAQRVDYLRRRRAVDVTDARALLQAALGELPAKERLALVEVLQQGLCSDDETLLVPLLKDRSRDVRQLAANLLALLPASAHAQRLITWLQPLLSSKRGLLFGKSWQIEAPLSAESAWAEAMIDSKRPQHESLGERGWWLYQIARQVALPWWVAHTGLRADELIAWAAKTDWKDALYRGWRERVGADNPDWIEAILSSRAKEFGHDRAALLSMLPVAQREKHWLRDLDTIAKSGAWSEMAASCPPGATLSAAFPAPCSPTCCAG